MTWYNAIGTYSRTGPFRDVALVGGPGNVNGFDTSIAHQNGGGKGIQFTPLNDEATNLKVELSLVAVGFDNGNYTPDIDGYVGPDGTVFSIGHDYEWLVQYEYSTDGGNNYTVISEWTKIATHSTPQALAYKEVPGLKPWTNTIVNYNVTLTNLPSNFTHVRVEVRGAEPAERYQNVYTRQQIVIPKPKPDLTTRWKKRSGEDLAPPVIAKEFQGPKTFDGYKYDGPEDSGNTRTHWYSSSKLKPWAIRKSGVFKSHNRPSGYMKIRKSGTFVDKSEILESDVNQPNKGSSRIRKSGSFVGQNKIGQQ